ncbi:DUF4258 domain-containing protein [Clostridiales bacterium COT073_COT-073]|nr:DUF4258 domain-containing protein [Clostridiales bacterium COT073_COT-073]
MEIKDIISNLSNILWSAHCLERMHSRKITRNEVKECIKAGEILEDYPNDFPHPSCLIYGLTKGNKVLHVVLGLTNIGITIITVYEPNNIIFNDDLKTRR